jgi:protoporphyrinogen/coproporphyrinogen III oxidase
LQALSQRRSASDVTPSTVAVVGGGFAGLLVAREISNSTNARVVVHEAEERAGGKVMTVDVEGIRVEAGPDSFLDRDSTIVTDICKSSGLGDELIEPAVFGGRVWVKGRLERLPAPSLYGLPATPRAAMGCTALSVRGRMRAAAEPRVPARRLDRDVSVGDFVRQRFGSEVLDRLVDPLLAGTRAGDVNEMSLAAALPQVYEIAQEHGSVMRGLSRDATGIEPPVFRALRGGMESLIDALQRDVSARAELRFGDRIERLTDRGDYYDLLSTTGRVTTADRVVLCVPPFVASNLLAGIDDRLARSLGAIEYASSASVALVYPPSSVPVPPDASGILVPSAEERTISGCTYFSAKWPHAAPSDGRQVVRCFVGRHDRHPALDLDDAALADAAHADLVEITGASADPIAAGVTRWERSLPQFKVGHVDRVTAIFALAERHRGLALAGAGYRGSGLPDVARSGYRAAAKVVRAMA